MIYLFDDYEFDTDLCELRRAGRLLKLEPKVFDVLAYLIEHRDRVVSQDELIQHLWSDQFVSDAVLIRCIVGARKALGDSGNTQQFIRTVRRHGYRFSAAVDTRAAGVTSASPAGRAVPEVTGSRPEALRRPQPGLSPPPPDVMAGERKPVTVLCCALADAAGVRARLGLDASHSLMRLLYELVRHEVQRYGGTLQPVAGDWLLAVFGAPVIQEDHARRAVLAALGLQRQIDAQRDTLGSPSGEAFAVQLGLHTGLVVVGGLGDEAGAPIAVVGDSMAMAVTLQDCAAPGMIVCSEATTVLLRGIVHVQALEPIRVAGQSSPMPVYQVLDVAPQRHTFNQQWVRALSPFVGRERELMFLETLVAQVQEGQGHVVSIVGEPGIGKSRLLDEFRSSLEETQLTWLVGRCLSYGQTTPYLLVLDVLRHNCGITEMDRPETVSAKIHQSLQEVGMAPEESAPYLLHLFGMETGTNRLAGLSPEAIKVRTFDVLVQMTVRGSQQRPLVLVVEDLHWVDATSEAGLAAFVEHLASAAILIVATYRPGYRPPWLEKSYATQ